MQPFLRSILLVLPALALASAPARACTMRGYPFRQWPGTVFMIAAGLPDTVEAGPGIRPVPGGAAMSSTHMGPPRPPVSGDRPVYGQVVQVERFGGVTAAELVASGGRAVLVPWGTHPDCSPAQWTGSARWAEPGVRGVIVAELRDREQWVAGLPTFDVRTPWVFPFPHRQAGAGRRADAPPLMEVEDYFGVLELLPAEARARASAADAYAPLFAWAAREPELARAWPAYGILEDAMWEVENERVRALSPEVAGTYRFEVALDGGRPAVFYGRTGAHPYMVDYQGTARRWDGGPVRARGYRMNLELSTRADSLPLAWVPREASGTSTGYAWLREHPEADADGRTWRGELHLGILRAAGDSAIDRFLSDEFRYYLENRRVTPSHPVRFTRRPDGAIVVEQSHSLPDGRVLRICGTRISPVVMTEAPRPPS
ncbi:MAG TPA: hypothetical protein VFQ45_01590 [Longimicrobium sp.]|nr:hypothetical protein [Longimicrobium sp.]